MRKSNNIGFMLITAYIIVEFIKSNTIGLLRPAIVLEVAIAILAVTRWAKLISVLNDTYFRLYIILIAGMTIMVPFALNNFYAFLQWNLMLQYLVFMVGFCMFIDDIGRIKRFMLFYILIMVIIALDAVFLGRYFFGGKGTLGEENDFALAMNMMAPVSFCLGMFCYKGPKHWLLLGCSGLFIAASMSAASRGGFLGLASVIILCWTKTKRKVVVLCLMVALLSVSFLMVPPEFKEELLNLTSAVEETTGRGRLELWKVAWRAFLDNPFFGVGQGNMPLQVGRYEADDRGVSFWGRDMSGTALHSLYFTILSELGLFGACIWLLMLVNLFRKYRFVKKHALAPHLSADEQSSRSLLGSLTLGFGIGLIGYFVSGAFLSVFYYPIFWHFASLITVIYMLAFKTNPPASEVTNLMKEPMCKHVRVGG